MSTFGIQNLQSSLEYSSTCPWWDCRFLHFDSDTRTSTLLRAFPQDIDPHIWTIIIFRMLSPEMLRPVAFVRTDVTEECRASIIRVTLMHAAKKYCVFVACLSCYLLPMLFLAHLFLSPWWWWCYVPPKCWFLQEPRGIWSQKTAFFIVTTIRMSNLTNNIYPLWNSRPVRQNAWLRKYCTSKPYSAHVGIILGKQFCTDVSFGLWHFGIKPYFSFQLVQNLVLQNCLYKVY
jgi:hypothetical protein